MNGFKYEHTDKTSISLTDFHAVLDKTSPNTTYMFCMLYNSGNFSLLTTINSNSQFIPQSISKSYTRNSTIKNISYSLQWSAERKRLLEETMYHVYWKSKFSPAIWLCVVSAWGDGPPHKAYQQGNNGPLESSWDQFLIQQWPRSRL